MPDDLQTRVDQLADELRELRRSLAAGLTTQHIRVVDATGRVRIELRAERSSSSVIARAGDDRDRSAECELFAVDPSGDDGDGAAAGVAVFIDGDSVMDLSRVDRPGSKQPE